MGEPLPLTNGDTRQAVAVVWQALGEYRDKVIPEGSKSNDIEWNEICTAMAWIWEELDG